MNQNESPTSDIEDNERMPTPPISTPPRETSPVRSRSPISSPQRNSPTRSRSPISSPQRLRSPTSSPPRSRSPISSPPRSRSPISSPARSSPLRSGTPESSPLRSRTPRSKSQRSRTPRSRTPRSRTPRSRSPISRSPRSSPPRSNPLPSTPPRSSPLPSTPPRSSPLPSTPPRSSPLRSTPPRSSPLRSTPPRSTPPRSTPPRSSPLISPRLRLTPMRLARLQAARLKTAPTRRTRRRAIPSKPHAIATLTATIVSAQTSTSPLPIPSTSTADVSTADVSTAEASTAEASTAEASTAEASTAEASTADVSTATTSDEANKKHKSWDPSKDFEIERIVGYHRDKTETMWYYVKWKGWGEKYNTYEPIENMTGCNYMLMKFFEYKKPTPKQYAAKDNEITASLETYEIYLKLKESNYKKEDLDEFSETCVDISKMFKKGSFVAFCKMIQREYRYIIRCLIGMCTHQDRGLIKRAKNYKIVLKMIKIRRKQLRENLASQNFINTLESTEIKIENYTDFDIFPKELNYVVDLKPGDGIVIPSDPTVGCDCENGCSAKSHCCGEMASTVFAYNRYRRVRSLERFAIYECNRRCTCPPDCLNRVVQNGMKIKLCIFKTEYCGWGVKTLEKISKGTFICEYVGELISDAEAVVRDIEYYKKNSSYVFDLDFSPDHDTNMYCIDATKYGNLARFINHSCDPNLVVYPVWIDCLEPNLHRLAFFARRNIKKGEELSIDYENAQDGHVPQLSKEEEEKKNQRTLRTLSRIRCRCGVQGCREWVFGN